MTTPSKTFLTILVLLAFVWLLVLPGKEDNPLWEVTSWIVRWLALLDATAWAIYCIWVLF